MVVVVGEATAVKAAETAVKVDAEALVVTLGVVGANLEVGGW